MRESVTNSLNKKSKLQFVGKQFRNIDQFAEGFSMKLENDES